MKIAITGANSSVGKNLLIQLATIPDLEIIAGVRSKSAFESLPKGASITPAVISYADVDSLASVLAGADCVIHLAGILIETKHSNYASANVAATETVVEAAKRNKAKHIIFISVVGASPDSNNAYFRSKGTAEKLVSQSGIPSSIIRTPILLGRGSAGTNSLKYATAKDKTSILGGGHYTMRPLDVDDLNNALTTLATKPATDTTTYELVGPETIAYRDLIKLAAEVQNKTIEVGSAPIWLAKIGSAISSIIKGGGMTPTVIDVITMNEKVAVNADAAIGIKLTPLRDTLSKILTEK
jgi:NADH dehydrogenase|tara:strand:- start:827 stop:1717 length:891 start_codon:yes stop_codon:yes gene_type:complete